MSTRFGTQDKETFRKFHDMMQDILNTLKLAGKINLSHVQEMDTYYEILRWTHWTFNNINIFDLVVRDEEKRIGFQKDVDKHNLKKDAINNMWDMLIIIAFLRYYWVIETTLGVLLKNVKYGTKSREKVDGRETLGQFKEIFKKLGIYHKFYWGDVDTGFRNALAHGWYIVKEGKFVYYENSQLQNPKELDQNQLIIKLRILYHATLGVLSVVGDWKKNMKALELNEN